MREVRLYLEQAVRAAVARLAEAARVPPPVELASLQTNWAIASPPALPGRAGKNVAILAGFNGNAKRPPHP